MMVRCSVAKLCRIMGEDKNTVEGKASMPKNGGVPSGVKFALFLGTGHRWPERKVDDTWLRHAECFQPYAGCPTSGDDFVYARLEMHENVLEQSGLMGRASKRPGKLHACVASSCSTSIDHFLGLASLTWP